MQSNIWESDKFEANLEHFINLAVVKKISIYLYPPEFSILIDGGSLCQEFAEHRRYLDHLKHD